MQRAQRRVAVTDGVDQYPNSDQVMDVVERPASHHHFLVDRIIVLGTAGDDRLDLGFVQVGQYRGHHTGDVRIPARRALGHQTDDLVVTLRVEGRESEILQLPLERVHPQPVGQRSVDLQRLPGFALLFVFRQEPQGPHVVQPGGKFDHQCPRVAGHRDHHATDRLGLGPLTDLHPVELHHRVENIRDVVTELVTDAVEGHVGLAHGAVQERGAQRRCVHAEISEDAGDSYGMRHIGVPGQAHLTGMHPGRGLERPLNRTDIRPGMVGKQTSQHRIQQRWRGRAM